MYFRKLSDTQNMMKERFVLLEYNSVWMGNLFWHFQGTWCRCLQQSSGPKQCILLGLPNCASNWWPNVAVCHTRWGMIWQNHVQLMYTKFLFLLRQNHHHRQWVYLPCPISCSHDKGCCCCYLQRWLRIIFSGWSCCAPESSCILASTQFIDWAMGQMIWGSNPGSGKKPFPYPKHPDPVRGPPSLIIFNGYWGCIPRAMQPGHEADCSPPSNT